MSSSFQWHEVSLSTLIRPFLQLSYPTARPANPDSFPNANYYDIGLLDGCFIISTMAVFAILREIVRLHIMTPFANKFLFGNMRGYQCKTLKSKKANGHANGQANGGHIHANGHSNGHANGNGHYAARRISARNRVRERNVIRFAEQGWAFVYYTIWWSFGVYIHFSLPTAPWKLDHLWIGYPHNPLPGPLKVYYLTQCAFWIHQLLIVNAEARRKDHIQMNAHHVITICLVFASYFLNLTRVGCLILVLMDFCDIVLPLAKMLRYLERTFACDCAFVTFLVSWFLTRHVAFLLILYSTLFRFPVLRPGAFIPNSGEIVTKELYYAFNAALIALQVLMCIWFTAIVKVAWSVMRGKPAEDTRSDEELPDSSDDEADDKLDEKKRQ
ncbi:sphingosine N-acyltransferase lag1 [Serendipita sp. 400]|nr:sphingosine N-acyltransferase lag1 [Serendipita sp. 400]